MTFLIGDIHGRYKELVAVLSKAKFDYQNDTLISIGDIVDRGPEPFLCIYELLKIKNLIAIKGNHDLWMHEWGSGKEKYHFLNGQDGSLITMKKWIKLSVEEKQIVNDFFEHQIYYHIDSQNRLFVHAGIDRTIPMHLQDEFELITTRSFFDTCLFYQKAVEEIETVEKFKEIYIGHTPTIFFLLHNDLIYKAGRDEIGITTPINIKNVWNIDTGAGYVGGKLSLMNLETKELYQEGIHNESY